jgi:hypothetical protein
MKEALGFLPTEQLTVCNRVCLNIFGSIDI